MSFDWNSKKNNNSEQLICLSFLFAVVTIYLTFSQNFDLLIFFVFCFIGLLLFVSVNIKLISKVILIGAIFLIWGLLLVLIHQEKWELKDLFNLIPQNYNLRHLFIEKIKNNYKFSDLILLIIFNEKTESIKEFYEKICNLGIAHLIVVSGLHLNLIYVTIKKIFKKHFKFKSYLSFLIIFIYGYFLNFSFGVLRVIGLIFFDIFSKRIKKFDLWTKNSLVGLITLSLNPHCVFDLGFQLSYLSIFGICLVKNYWKFSKLITFLFVSFVVNLLIGPILLNINGKISLLAIFNSWIMTPIIMFYYFFTMAIIFLPFLWDLTNLIYPLLITIVNLLTKINLFFKLNIAEINKWIVYTYYLIFFVIWLLLNFEHKWLRIRYNNKIDFSKRN